MAGIAGGATVIGWYCTKDLLDLRPLVETGDVETDGVETDAVGADAAGADTAGADTARTLDLRPMAETVDVETDGVETDAVGTDKMLPVEKRSNTPTLPLSWIIRPEVREVLTPA